MKKLFLSLAALALVASVYSCRDTKTEENAEETAETMMDNAEESIEEAGDAETAQYYKTDAEVIRDIINRLKGVQVKNEDLFYQQYESRDGYLSRISDESLEVLQHFGEEAPVLLNKYACAVEDALIEQVKKNQELIMELKALKGEAETKQGNILDSVKEKLGAMKAGIFSHC